MCIRDRPFVQAFVACHLDYCDLLLCGMSNNLILKIQSVQNSAAWLVTRTRRCANITQVQEKLLWSPVRRRVELKLAFLVHHSLTGQTLTFLASDIQLTAATGHPEPWSAAERICVVPHTYNSFGDRSFSAAGPRVEYSASICTMDIPCKHWKDVFRL